MMQKILSFVLLTLLFLPEICNGLPIHRENRETTLEFKDTDLLKAHGEQDFENGWLKKDLGYRQGCFIQTIPFDLPYQANLDLTVHYEASWRDVIDNVADLSEMDIARFDLAYEKTDGNLFRESHFLSVAEVGNLNWVAQGVDYIQARAESKGSNAIHFKTIVVPNASKNIRAKMCGIAPNSKIRVDKIEIRLSHFDDFMTAINFNSNDLLHCYDNGLFLSKCNLQKKILSNSEHVEMDYKINLEFDCDGHEVEFNFETDITCLALHSKKGHQELNISGRKLNLVDLNPDKTIHASFNKGCFLKIHKVEKSISEAYKNDLLKKKKDLEDRIEISQIGSQTVSDLATLAHVVVAIKASLKLINYKFESLIEQKNFIKGILKSFERPGQSDLFDKLLFQNAHLNHDEKKAVLRLKNALKKTIDDEAECEAFSFERMLSNTQVAFLGSLLEKKQIFLESEKNYELFKEMEEISKQELKNLWCESKEFIEWGDNYEI